MRRENFLRSLPKGSEMVGKAVDILENCWLLLPDRRVGKGDVRIAGGKIAEIIERDCCPDRLVMPGLVNCHGHTAMTLVRGVGSGLPLSRWLSEAIFPIEAKMTAEDVRAGTIWGAIEMLAGGTTEVAEMYDFPGTVGEAFREVGIKANLGRVGLSIVPNRIDECIEFVRNWNNDGVVADLSVHSEYLTDEKFCRALAEANRAFRRPVHVHISETEAEHHECIARHGKTPIAYFADIGLFDYGGYAAHCVWCTDDDFRIMAERGVTLVNNPTSNMKLSSGLARTAAAKAIGVSVAIGTDGCASNDNLDMFEEMHIASLIQKGITRDPTCLSAWDVIEMATKNGAKALGRTNAGELKVGYAADLCVVNMDRPHLMPAHDIPNLVVNSMHASDVTATIVDGKMLYDRGAFTTIDYERAKADFLSAVHRLFQGIK